MILNSQSAELIRTNASRLAQAVKSKDDLIEFATAGTFEQLFGAIESLLTHTDMFFDDELIANLDDTNWRNFKATLLVYTFNMVNRMYAGTRQTNSSGANRDFGATASA